MLGGSAMLPEIHLGAVWNMWNAYGWNSVLWFGGMGLIFKFALLAYFLRLSLSTALLADMATNVTSCLIFAVTPAPILVPSMLLHQMLWSWLLGIGVEHSIHWILALFFAALIAAIVDSLILAFGFSQPIPARCFGWVLAVNLVCVCLTAIPHVAYVSSHPPQARSPYPESRAQLCLLKCWAVEAFR
jgi:hypothetical protein